MSNRETAVEIHRTLDGFKAPSGETVSERIRGLVGPAAAALHDAGFVVGEGTLAEAITAALSDAKAARHILTGYVGESGSLADIALRMERLRNESIRQRDEQVLIRGRVETREADAEERAAAFEGVLHAANIANGELLADLASQRAEVARLSAQLDYATGLLTKRCAS